MGQGLIDFGGKVRRAFSVIILTALPESIIVVRIWFSTGMGTKMEGTGLILVTLGSHLEEGVLEF